MSTAIFTKDVEIAARILNGFGVANLQWSIAQAIADERERCAQIAEGLNGWGSARKGNDRASELAAHIAKIIRGIDT